MHLYQGISACTHIRGALICGVTGYKVKLPNVKTETARKTCLQSIASKFSFVNIFKHPVY